LQCRASQLQVTTTPSGTRPNRSFTLIADVGSLSCSQWVGHLRATRSALAAAALAALSVILLAGLQAQPRDRTRVAAIFSPWTSGERAITRVAQAGGLVVRRGIVDSIVVVQGDDPAIVDRLYAAGAWAVVDPAAWGGCLAPQTRPRG